MADDFDPFGLRGDTAGGVALFAPSPSLIPPRNPQHRPEARGGEEHHQQQWLHQQQQQHQNQHQQQQVPHQWQQPPPPQGSQQRPLTTIASAAALHHDELFGFDLAPQRVAQPSQPMPRTTGTGNNDDGSSSLFDPFNLATRTDSLASSASSARRVSISPPPEVSRIHRANNANANNVSATRTTTTTGLSSNATSASMASASLASASANTVSTIALLPPKLVVRLSVHEEVASVAAVGSRVNNENKNNGEEEEAEAANIEGAAEITVEGTVLAQVQSSDATKNAPFALLAAGGGATTFAPDPRRARSLPPSPSPLNGSSSSSRPHTNFPGVLVSVPKEEIGFVPVGRYRLTERVPHTPLLLERKVTFQKTTVRIAVQVRSRLTNAGDLEDLTMVVAIPEHVDGRTVRIVRGDGTWDDLKRIVKWRLKALRRGESYMVSATARLWREPKGAAAAAAAEESTTSAGPVAAANPNANSDADPYAHIRFPVLLRCTASSDQVSTVELRAVAADGHPASLTVARTSSFRMLHRLP